MKSNLLKVFLFVSLFCSACRKVTDTLPAETCARSYTIGFKADGKIYTTSGNARDLLNDGAVSYNFPNYDSDHSLYISAKKSFGDNDFEIWLVIQYKDSVTGYQLKDDYKGTFFLGGNPDPNDPTSSNVYTTTNLNTGKVIITCFDGKIMPYYPGTILAGTFEMDCVNKNGKVIHITDGRFDIGN
ncbi:MAG: hypothetical protein ABIY62_00675 [Ginsengibacter sp.]